LAYREGHNPKQAKSELSMALEAAPGFVDAAVLLAQLNLESGNAGSAIEAMEKLVATQPRMAQAYVLLGTAYLSKRNPGKAFETFQKMEKAAPHDARAPYLAGVALRAQGKLAEAAREFERALAIAPGFVDALAALVGQALAERRPGAALDRVKKQIALTPPSAPLHILMGYVHQARHETAEAEAAYLAALKLDPASLPAYLGLGRLYLETRDEARALARFEEALSVRPDDVVARMLAAQIYVQQGDAAKAKAAYERILTVNASFVPAANNLAWLLAQEGQDKERALRLAQIAKEYAPDDPHVSDTLGWVLFQRGLYERAWSLLRESAGKLADNPEVQYHAGMAARRVGQLDVARAFLQRATDAPGKFSGQQEAEKALAELSR
jgi:tetratricopeptide (TPR) repeat protein